MESVRSIIKENNEKYEHFSYYEIILDKIQENVIEHPDICIESCKSLIEGVSKTILITLDSDITEREIKSLDVMPLFRKATNKLAEFDEEIELDFATRSCSLIQNFGEIRNQRGDISHGRAAPKTNFSTPKFSAFAMQITESLIFYMLDSFFRIELLNEAELQYEDNSEYNLMLDETTPLAGRVRYSEALFYQDYPSYFQQLLNYNSEQEAVAINEEEE